MRKTGFFRNCERCTKPYWVYQYNKNTRRWCSTSCSNKSNSERQSSTKRSKSKLNLGNTTRRQFDDWQYIEWRNKCLTRDGYVCIECGKDVSGKSQAVVHHPKSWEGFPELRYDVNNGEVLCRSCHNIEHILPSRKKRSGF